jgi:hypothetical protein
MITYHRLLLITTFGSALVTFGMLQLNATIPSAVEAVPSQQMQSAPSPSVTEYYVMGPRLMTLAWQPCADNACLPQTTSHRTYPAEKHQAIGI